MHFHGRNISFVYVGRKFVPFLNQVLRKTLTLLKIVSSLQHHVKSLEFNIKVELAATEVNEVLS